MVFAGLKSLFEKGEKPPALDAAMRTQLAGHFEKIRDPVDVVASLDEGEKSHELRALLDEIATLCAKINVRHDGDDVRRPSFSVARRGEAPRIAFAAIPLGHELTSLVLALVQVGGHPPRVDAGVIEAIGAIPGTLCFETYITLNCHNCPDLVQALNVLALLNPGIRHTTIDGMLFRQEIDQHKIVAVPALFLNGRFFDQGRKTLGELVAKLSASPLADAQGKAGAAE